MPAAQKLALLTFIFGAVFGLIVLGAAWAAGHPRRLPFWLAGTVWGMLASAMVLSDCLSSSPRPGAVSNAAFPVYVAGVFGFPAALVWKRDRWYWRWLLAQGVTLLTLAPAFVAAVVAALCVLQ